MVKSPEKANWILDSGATSHMTQMRELLTDYQELERPETVKLGDGNVVEAVGVGNVHLNMIFDDSKPKKSNVPCALCAKACMQPRLYKSCSSKRQHCEVWYYKMLDSRQ